MQVMLKRLDPDLPVPARANPGDAGVDLVAAADASIAPGDRHLMPTGVAVAIPEGYAGLVTPRSGLAVQRGVGIVNSPGLVDSGYRGEIKVILVNHGRKPVDIARGDRIAQLVVTPVESQDFVEVEELPESARGEGGFGSSGA